LTLNTKKKDINTEEKIFASLEFDFFEFSSSLLLKYGRKSERNGTTSLHNRKSYSIVRVHSVLQQVKFVYQSDNIFSYCTFYGIFALSTPKIVLLIQHLINC